MFHEQKQSNSSYINDCTLLNKSRKKELWEVLERSVEEGSEDLPVYRVVRTCGKGDGDGEGRLKLFFLEGEIVVGDVGRGVVDEGLRRVWGFEGVVGLVEDAALERVERPWGLPRVVGKVEEGLREKWKVEDVGDGEGGTNEGEREGKSVRVK